MFASGLYQLLAAMPAIPAAPTIATAMIMIAPTTIERIRPMIPVILPTFVNDRILRKER